MEINYSAIKNRLSAAQNLADKRAIEDKQGKLTQRGILSQKTKRIKGSTE